jgi:hypothetical protein
MNRIKSMTGFDAVTGDFSPIYLYCKTAANRIAEINPNAKLIIMLRNPIHRAYSEYSMFHDRTLLEPRTFEQAIEDELKGVSLGHYVRETYLKRGIYEPYIRTYFDLFDRNQIMIIKAESFFSNTQAVVNNVLKFLGLYDGLFTISNYYKNETIYTSSMNHETFKFLQNYYKTFNQSLYDYLNIDMGWD